MKSRIAIIGSGISGLSTACYLAKAGAEVTIYEKNDTIGGRARQFQAGGFTFDMGPSWYWMPDVFERFFADFDKKPSDYYHLKRLHPNFKMIYGPKDAIEIPADPAALHELFDQIEPGAGARLSAFFEDAAYKYEVGMKDLVYKPGLSLLEFMNLKVIKGALRLNLTTPFDKFVSRYFKHPKLKQLMEFPVLFLGAAPAQTPALYSLMNYAGLVLGTWYPEGGMFKIIEGMASLAESLGVTIKTGHEVVAIQTNKNRCQSLTTTMGDFTFDHVVSSADYHHTDNQLIPASQRNYGEQYWDKRVMAPSSLLFYLGIDRKVPGLKHHTLFFDEDLTRHAHEIYTDPAWPERPLFYVCSPSKTDASVAPEGHENVFILMPLAAGLKDVKVRHQQYFDVILDRMTSILGLDIRPHIVYRRDYCLTDFQKDYHAYKGNAYGLANTLSQTAVLKPRIKNRHLKNLHYTGHLTVPGPGVPPAIISGKIVADQIIQMN